MHLAVDADGSAADPIREMVLWATHNAGDSFKLVYTDEGGLMPGSISPVADGVPIGSDTPRVVFAHAPHAVFGAGVIDPVLGPRPALGAPNYNDRFVVPDNFASSRVAFAIAHDVDWSHPFTISGLSVWRCTADFACPQRLAGFGNADVRAVTTTPDASTIYLTVGDRKTGAVRAYRTTDSGATWQPFNAVDALLTPINQAPAAYRSASIAISPSRPADLALRITHTPPPRQDPRVAQEQLFISHDFGAHWTRIGYASDIRGRRIGNLPWSNPEACFACATGSVAFLPNGNITVVAASTKNGNVQYIGPFTRDRTGRWRRVT